jgi:hypothetical protein
LPFAADPGVNGNLVEKAHEKTTGDDVRCLPCA